MVRIIVDGKEYQADEKKNLLEAVLSEKLNLQYFCWHPALGSVGACRQCAVKKFRDENDKQGKIVMACMEPVSENAIISINDPEAKEFRAGIIEWLMTNHPHDCPVCDEGGECHLQDMTVMSGHNYRRYRFTKRTYRNQYLGPFINHEMNRCIQCYRCVRYYRDYADGKDFDAFGIHNNVYFGRAEDGILENEFAGNLVEVCPTGVFTDKTLGRHYTRKWDLTNGPSICHFCSVGCNTIASERYGSLRRILSRYNSEVNGYFLCDRGRFGYEFVNSEKRIYHPLIRDKKGGQGTPVTVLQAITDAGSKLSTGKTAAIGSPRASLESNFAIMNFAGKENFFAGVGKKEFELTSLVADLMQKGGIKIPSLNDIEQCEAVFILGEDVTNTAPMTALALRQASRKLPAERAAKIKIPGWHATAVKDLVQDDRGPFYIAHPFPTKLDDIQTDVSKAAPDEIALFGFALANRISSSAPAVENMSDDLKKRITAAAGNLAGIKSAVVVCGTSLLNEAIIHAAYNLALALQSSGVQANLSFIVPECNSIGLNLLAGKSLDDLVSKSAGYDNLLILENDLYRREERSRVDELLAAVKNIIVIDHLYTETSLKADLVIPAGTFAESDGTLISSEGRAQRFYQVYDSRLFNSKVLKESWRWIKQLAEVSGKTGFDNLEVLTDFTSALSSAYPVFSGIENIAPPPGFREAGQKIPREPHRYSGRTAMLANVSIHEPKPPQDADSPLSFTMEGYRGEPPSSIIPFFWSPGWNSAQSINKYQIEIGGPLHGGDTGKRLFEPLPAAGKYFTKIPSPASAIEGEYLALPLYHIYGSEEQSNNAMSLMKLIPAPYIMISSEDAKGLKIKENLSLVAGDQTIKAKVKISDGVKKGIIGIPSGLPGMEYVKIPSLVKIGSAE